MSPSMSLEDLLVEGSSAPPPPPPSAGSDADSDSQHSTTIPWERWRALRGGTTRKGQYEVGACQMQSFPETWIWDSASSSASSSSSRTVSPGPSDGYPLHHCEHIPERCIAREEQAQADDRSDGHLALSQQRSPERRETWQQALINPPEWCAIERASTAPSNFSPVSVEQREMTAASTPRESVDSEVARRHSLYISTVASAAVNTSAPVRFLRRSSTVAEGLARRVSTSMGKGVKEGTRKLSSGTRRISKIFKRKDSVFDDQVDSLDFAHYDGSLEASGVLGREIPLMDGEVDCPPIDQYGRMSTRSDWQELDWQAGEHMADMRILPASPVRGY